MKINFGLISAAQTRTHSCIAMLLLSARRKPNSASVFHTLKKARIRPGAHLPGMSAQSNAGWLTRVVDTRGVANCPALMGNIDRMFMPQRWEDTPPAAYDPLARLKVLDEDGVDGEVLFCNNPAFGSCFIQCDAELELACAQAYNDAIWEWREASDRYVPLMIIPYFGGIQATVGELTRCARKGVRGLIMLAEPSSVGDDKFFKKDAPVNPAFRHCLKHFCDAYWEPLWAACQDLGIAIHWHADGGLKTPLSVWRGFSAYELFAVTSPAAHSSLAQFIPNVVFSRVLERYPRLTGYAPKPLSVGSTTCSTRATGYGCSGSYGKRESRLARANKSAAGYMPTSGSKRPAKVSMSGIALGLTISCGNPTCRGHIPARSPLASWQVC